MKRIVRLILLIALAACASDPAPVPTPTPTTWEQIFDGESLDGWVVKIAGQDLGQDRLNTFRLGDGSIRVSYDGYETFDGQFGLLYFERELSHYRLRLDYRFSGTQTPGAPDWAKLNSGVMLHAQAPETMARDQSFPVSIEAQFLGPDPARMPGSTLNLCTPGTHVEIEGRLVTDHCVVSRAPVFPVDDWVSIEVEVRGGAFIRHLIDGEPVLAYEAPQLDPADGHAAFLLRQGASLRLDRGYIALQAEGHPVGFRNIELLDLTGQN